MLNIEFMHNLRFFLLLMYPFWYTHFWSSVKHAWLFLATLNIWVCNFFQVLPESSGSLQLPKPEKHFLISPPASPPVGWEPLEEPVPVINYDLLSAVSALSNEPQELHPETELTPGIIVHGCPNPGEDPSNESEYHPLNILPRHIVQTSRPPLQ